MVVNQNATFAVAVAGSSPLSYQWLLNGTNLPSTALIQTFAVAMVPPASPETQDWPCNAGLDQPQGVTTDASGNLYFSDSEHSRVRKVGTNGLISTVAGNGADSALFRGRWTGHRRQSELSFRCRRGQIRKPLHRGRIESARPQGGPEGPNLHGGGQRGLRVFLATAVPPSAPG